MGRLQLQIGARGEAGKAGGRLGSETGPETFPFFVCQKQALKRPSTSPPKVDPNGCFHCIQRSGSNRFRWGEGVLGVDLQTDGGNGGDGDGDDLGRSTTPRKRIFARPWTTAC